MKPLPSLQLPRANIRAILLCKPYTKRPARLGRLASGTCRRCHLLVNSSMLVSAPDGPLAGSRCATSCRSRCRRVGRDPMPVDELPARVPLPLIASTKSDAMRKNGQRKSVLLGMYLVICDMCERENAKCDKEPVLPETSEP